MTLRSFVRNSQHLNRKLNYDNAIFGKAEGRDGRASRMQDRDRRGRGFELPLQDRIRYYVTWAKVFPDKIDMPGLPYKKAYESAVAMLEAL